MCRTGLAKCPGQIQLCAHRDGSLACPLGQQVGSSLDGIDNAGIGAASADVPLHRLNDLFFRGIVLLMQQRCCTQNHPRGAVTALECALVKECLLNGAELPVLLQTLDGNDLCIGGRLNGNQAGTGRSPVEQYSAGSALAFPAAVLGPGQIQSVAQDGEQSLLGRAANAEARSIDVEIKIAHLNLHIPPGSINVHISDYSRSNRKPKFLPW